MTRVDLEPRYIVGIVCVVGLLSAPLLMPILTLRQLTAALFLGMFAMSWDYVSAESVTWSPWLSRLRTDSVAPAANAASRW